MVPPPAPPHPGSQQPPGPTVGPSHCSLKPPDPGDFDARKTGLEGSGGQGHPLGQVLPGHS